MGIRSSLAEFAGLYLQARERWRAYDVYLSAMLIFAASRLVVIVGINFGTLLVRIPKPESLGCRPAWYHRLLRWDSGWYAAIVSDGYRYIDDASVEGTTAFYPLYPLLSYAVKSLFGINHFVALLLVANVASVVAMLLMTKFVKDELGDEIALLSLAFFSFFPSSLFLSAGYTESLFLVFVLLSFILMAREKFALAAAMAGLSLGTRSTGIVMIPVILWEMGRRNAQPWPRFLPRMALCGVLAASGLLVYMSGGDGEACLQPVAESHEFIDLGDDAVLFGERWKGKQELPESRKRNCLLCDTRSASSRLIECQLTFQGRACRADADRVNYRLEKRASAGRWSHFCEAIACEGPESLRHDLFWFDAGCSSTRAPRPTRNRSAAVPNRSSA